MPSLEITQPHPDTIIWRYVSYKKLLDMVMTRSLFFSQAKQFEDPDEGTPTMTDIGPVAGTPLEDIFNELYTAPNGPRTYTTVSCWRMDDHQSPKMWDDYIKKDDIYLGVALQSTVGRLRASICGYDQLGIISGAVNYYVRPLPELGKGDATGTNMFFHKGSKFTYEQEYRLIHRSYNLMSAPYLTGKRMPVNLKTLIQRIYAPSRIGVKFVREGILGKIPIPVERTTIFDPPSY